MGSTMTSGADLFVVCKQCNSEVSPYITECPYCGNRLRRRAPKLPPAKAPSKRTLRGRARSLLAPRERPLSSVGTMPRVRSSARRPSRWAADRPYATIALVAASCVMWVVVHAEPALYLHTAIVGPLQGDWWKLLTSEFAYVSGIYAFVAILTVAIFGWLLESRHGPAAVLALFFGAGAAGALVADAAYRYPLVSGANAAALALVAAWAAPDLEAARTGAYREGDLLGAGVLAALLLAVPFARPEASWLAGVVAGAIGLAVGLGMRRLSELET
jgi:membrane associated rhomboid family serine protease